MGEINFFPDDLEIKDQKVILRLDLNVPIKDKVIRDDTRIILCLPFINKLIQKKAKIIIISHLGRPKGINVPELTLIPIYKYLKDKLKENNIHSKVVSMPCMELFDKQPEDYRKDILEENSLIITLEAGSVVSWQKYIKNKGANLGINKFGESAPYKEVYQHFKLSEEDITNFIQKKLRE